MKKKIIIAMIFISNGVLLDTQNQVKYVCYENSSKAAYLKSYRVNDFWGSSHYLGGFKNYPKCIDKLKEMSK
jgi:hypothetical protein